MNKLTNSNSVSSNLNGTYDNTELARQRPSESEHRLQQINQLQKQFSLYQQQMQQLKNENLRDDQEWTSMAANTNKKQQQQQLQLNSLIQNSLSTLNQFDENLLSSLTPQQQQQLLQLQQPHNQPQISPTSSLNDEWLVNTNKLSNNTQLESLLKQQQFQQQQQQQHKLNSALSPQSNASSSSTQWLNATKPTQSLQQQQQMMLNNFQSSQYLRPQSPFDASSSSSKPPGTSRSQTPANLIMQQQNLFSGLKLNNDSVINAINIGTNLTSLSSIGSGSGSSSSSSGSHNSNMAQSAHLLNGLVDDLLPFGHSSSMAQNFNQLSKLITPQALNALNNINDLNALTNLNELANLNNNNNNNSNGMLLNNVYSDSNSPQSPPLASMNMNIIAGGGQSTFSGNGNLNPPVRQNCKMANMTLFQKFGALGPSKAQFNSPHGFCLGVDEEIIVADTNNHRIQVFSKSGDFKYAFGSPGREEGQLWYPRKVAVMRSSSKFVICDRGNERSRMQIFNKSGHYVRKISIRYIDIVAGLAITQQNEIVAVDSVSPTVFRISEEGDLLKWFDCSDFMREPSDIAIHANEYYVCDFKGHCVVVFSEEGNFLRRIGGENITNFPNGIDVGDQGDVLVGDSHGNRFHVAVFSKDGTMLSELECPHVKVSRCCGLKITNEGHIVTLAKNNHHVLVLNTIYLS